jgi:hypothetical protein
MAEERRDYAILISLYMREEAEVMASALRAEGIDAFVGNRHHANVDWGWVIALGGMQVFVPRAKLAEAREAIRARLRDVAGNPDQDAEPTKRRDRWKVWTVIIVTLLLPVGGLTAHTIDEHRNRVAFQAEVDEFIGFNEELRRVYSDADRAFCEKNPDSLIDQTWDGVTVTRTCSDLLAQAWPRMTDSR